MLNSCVLIGKIEKIEKIKENHIQMIVKTDSDHIPVLYLGEIEVDETFIGKYAVVRGRITTRKDTSYPVVLLATKIDVLTQASHEDDEQ